MLRFLKKRRKGRDIQLCFTVFFRFFYLTISYYRYIKIVNCTYCSLINALSKAVAQNLFFLLHSLWPFYWNFAKKLQKFYSLGVFVTKNYCSLVVKHRNHFLNDIYRSIVVWSLPEFVCIVTSFRKIILFSGKNILSSVRSAVCSKMNGLFRNYPLQRLKFSCFRYWFTLRILP